MEVEAGTHIEYLAGQDITHSKAFWKKSLQGFTVPTPLTVARTILKNELITEYQEQTINLPKTLVSALELLARLHNLTINTLLHGAWALLLSRYSCESDVVFGIQLTSANCGLESIAYKHTPLAKVQEWSDIPIGTPLFESLLVLSDAPIATEAKDQGSQELHVEWNKTQVDYPRDKCIHQLKEEQVERSPEAIAVVMPSIRQGADKWLTYRELNDRANQLAYHLKQLGVEPSTFVAMSMERSIEMIVAMLGILQVGGGLRTP